MHNGRPDRSEAGEYYFTYIDRIQEDDICAVLEAQHVSTLGALAHLTRSQRRALLEAAPELERATPGSP